MKTIKIDTFLEYRYLSNPLCSPNGKYTAFCVQQANSQINTYSGKIYVYHNQTGELNSISAPDNQKAFLWSSESTLLLPIAQGDTGTVYHEWNLESEENRVGFQVPLRCAKAELADANRLVISAVETISTDASDSDKGYTVLEESPFWGNGKGFTNGKRNHIYLFDRVSGALTPIVSGSFDVAMYTVSEEAIVYSGDRFNGARCDRPGIYRYDLKSGKNEEMLPSGLYYVRLVCELGGQVIFSGSKGETFGKHEYTGFYAIDGQTKTVSLFAKYSANVGVNSVLSDSTMGLGQKYKVSGDRLYFVTTQKEHSVIRMLEKNGQISEPLTSTGTVEAFDLVGNDIVYCGLKGLNLCELYFLKDGAETCLTCFNEFFLAEYELSCPEPVSFIDRDGFEIRGWVLKPIGYREDESYPAILHIHGGPRSTFSDVLGHEMQVWAAKGNFVLLCNPRGSDSRGNEFGAISGRYGTIDYDNLMDFTDKVLSYYPQIDQSRVGVAGGSYGGYMVNWMIGHTDRFAAAVSQRSIANWITLECMSDIGYYYVPDQVGASLLTGGVAKLWDNSPLKYAENAKTPTLFIHSDQDYRCWMPEVLQMFYVLKQKQVPSRVALFHGENHELSRNGRPKNRISRMEEICRWFDRYLR